MKQTTKQKSKWALLGLAAVAVPTATVVTIYETQKQTNNKISTSLGDKVNDQMIGEEVNRQYDEMTTPERIDSDNELRIKGIVAKSVKKNLAQDTAIGIPIDKSRLKDIIKRELDDALMILEVNLQAAMKMVIQEDKEADFQVLYSIYESKHKGAANLEMEKLVDGVSADVFDKLWFHWPNKQLKMKVPFHEVYHREQLNNLIRDLDQWYDYHLERNYLIKSINESHTTMQYRLYSVLWDEALALQEQYENLGYKIPGWINFDVNSKLGDVYLYNSRALDVYQKRVQDWTNNAKELIQNGLSVEGTEDLTPVEEVDTSTLPVEESEDADSMLPTDESEMEVTDEVESTDVTEMGTTDESEMESTDNVESTEDADNLQPVEENTDDDSMETIDNSETIDRVESTEESEMEPIDSEESTDDADTLPTDEVESIDEVESPEEMENTEDMSGPRIGDRFDPDGLNPDEEVDESGLVKEAWSIYDGDSEEESTDQPFLESGYDSNEDEWAGMSERDVYRELARRYQS